MSRQNKVNPGQYTQRGRLTQDDAARELRKQTLIGSPHTWQPVNTRTRPPLAPAGDANRKEEASADNETMAETSPKVGTGPTSRVTKKKTLSKSATSNAKAKAATAKTATTRQAKRTTGKAKAGTAAKTGTVATTAMKRRTSKPTRKGVRARNVGGGGAASRSTMKRRNESSVRGRRQR